jgi:hypothetical protein
MAPIICQFSLTSVCEVPLMPDNLWPDFDAEPQLRSVRRILIEAGAGLAERTGSRLQFIVDSKAAGKARFSHDCFLFAPLLAYRYPLCKLVETGDPYPVFLHGDGTFEKGVAAGDEAALIENLRLLFNAGPTKRVVQQVLEIASSG